MAGEVKHQWNGSVLTVISDSGASSADLRGPKGDTGPRGPQGPAGVIYDDNGELVLDLSIFYTTGEIDEMFQNYTPDLSNYATSAELLEVNENLRLEIENHTPDLTGYATEKYVDEQIVNVATGGSIDLSNYYTKEDVDTKIEDYRVNVDDLTIRMDSDGYIYTAIGGSYKDYIFNFTDLNINIPNTLGVTLVERENVHNLVDDYETYNVKVVYEDGIVEEGIITRTRYTIDPEDKEGDREIRLTFDIEDGRINGFYCITDLRDYYPDVFGAYPTSRGVGHYIKEFYLWDKDMGYNPIDANFIPVDGISIQVNNEGKLVATGASAELELTQEMIDRIVEEVIATMSINTYSGEREDING